MTAENQNINELVKKKQKKRSTYNQQFTACFYIYSDHCHDNMCLFNGITTIQKFGDQNPNTVSTGAQAHSESSRAKPPEAEIFLKLDAICELKPINILMKYYLKYFSMRITECEFITYLSI
jgi:hypothetical protein